MQIKACSVTLINSGILRFVGIVYDTVFTILYIGMYFYVVVAAEPAMQVFFIVCSPQDRTVQHTAVFKAVWQTADIDASSFSKRVDCHLHFFIDLADDRSIRQSIHVFLSFSEVHISLAVLSDKVGMLFPVVFVFVQVKSIFAFHSKNTS